ncbi:MAG: class I SAM-dependent methyltransferase [Desulfobacterales bacterium]|nr:MAG: class I SAM-dependent methyltransferase [Desulfobacterales bacterium]
MRCLDYGCYDGNFIKTVTERKDVDFVGVDKNRTIVSENPYGLSLIHVEGSLPFPDESFDCVTALDVLEHIYDQDFALKEINRVLKNHGVLIATVPRKHIFSFLDLKNLSFVFPRLSRRLLCLVYSRERYKALYVNHPDGLVGDIEKEKSWHEHFTPASLRELLGRNGFRVDRCDGSGLFLRVFLLFDFLKIGFVFPESTRFRDCRKFEQANLFCTAVKTGSLEDGF